MSEKAGKEPTFFKRHRSLLKFLLTLLIATLVFRALASRLAGMQLYDVLHSLDAIPYQAIVPAACLSVLSYGVLLTSYEYIGQAYIHRFLGWRRLFFASFITYTFNFNLGSLLGAIATRFRIYRRWRLKHNEIARLTSACVFTSWLGYVFLLGCLLMIMPEVLFRLHFHNIFLARSIGVVLLASIAWLFASATRPRTIHFHRWHLRTFTREQLALALGVSTLQWLTISGMIYVFLSCFTPVDFTLVLFAYLLAAIASVIAHVPAGLGVVEGTFILIFADITSSSNILAAMIAFRTVYYFIPFVFGCFLFVAEEVRHWRQRTPAHSMQSEEFQT